MIVFLDLFVHFRNKFWKVGFVIYMYQLQTESVNIMYPFPKKGTGSRVGWRGQKEKAEGWKEKLRCVMHMYRFPIRNANIMYCTQYTFPSKKYLFTISSIGRALLDMPMVMGSWRPEITQEHRKHKTAWDSQRVSVD